MEAKKMPMNLVLNNENDLRANNYILHPSPDNKFWANISGSRVDEYVQKCGEAFNIILVGSSDEEGDFYAIPYSIIKPVLIEEYRTSDKTGRLRWVVSIRNHQLLIRRYPAPIDVSSFYGNQSILKVQTGVSIPVAEANDYAIENRKTEIQQRLKQSLFRKRVAQNFRGECCLSGIQEDALLIASHIIPWSKRIETRLDPANGLFLFVSYDHLFDQGFISLDNDLVVLVTPNIENLSLPLRKVLMQINGQRAQQPSQFQIKVEYLEYHRQHIFQGGTLNSAVMT